MSVFSVVEFTSTEEVEAVPKIWLTDDGKCWWPNYKGSFRMMQAIKKCEVPTPEHFQSFAVRVFRHCDSYEKASHYARKAQDDSDLNSEPESTPKSRHSRVGRPQRLGISLENSSDEGESGDMPEPKRLCMEQVMPPPPVPVDTGCGFKKMSNKSRGRPTPSFPRVTLPPPPAPPPLPSTSTFVLSRQEPSDTGFNDFVPSHVLGLVTSEDNEHTQASNSNLHLASSSDHRLDSEQPVSVDPTPMDLTRPAANSKFETWVIRNMSIMKAQLNQIQESIDVLHDHKLREVSGSAGTCAKAGETEDEGYKLLPIGSLEQMDKLKDILSDESKRRALVAKLSNRGGNSASECVRRILQRLLTNDMAVKFNWIGSRGQKSGFKNSILLELVYEATRNSKRMGNVEEKVMEDIIKDWLKNAKKRIASEEASKTKCQSRGDLE